MSIVKMKRLRLLSLASQREELLARLQHAGCVEVLEPDLDLQLIRKIVHLLGDFLLVNDLRGSFQKP